MESGFKEMNEDLGCQSNAAQLQLWLQARGGSFGEVVGICPSCSVFDGAHVRDSAAAAQTPPPPAPTFLRSEQDKLHKLKARAPAAR